MNSIETQPASESCPRRGRIIREIILDWPEPPIAFQPIRFDWSPVFPVLLFPWGAGRQLIYSTDDQNTYWERIPPSWWLYPNTTRHLNGEEYRPSMGRIKYAWYFIKGWEDASVEIPAASWMVNDVYDPTADANSRAYQLVNLPAQPEGVIVTRPVQVNSVETFNKYLRQMQDDGFLGTLIRPLTHLYGQTQYAALRPLPESP
jgi:hypothetical protein